MGGNGTLVFEKNVSLAAGMETGVAGGRPEVVGRVPSRWAIEEGGGDGKHRQVLAVFRAL